MTRFPLDMLAEADGAKVASVLRTQAVFYRTLKSGATIDSALVMQLAVKSGEPMRVYNQLGMEYAFYTSLVGNPAAIEEIVMRFLPIHSVVFWQALENGGYLVSESTGEVLPCSSIVGRVLEENELIATQDPANHPLFSLEVDLPLLRDVSAMVLVPVVTKLGEPIGVLQCIDRFDGGAFTEYDLDLLSMVAKVAREVPAVKVDPLPMFLQILRKEGAVPVLRAWLAREAACELVDIFEVREHGRSVRDVSTGVVYDDAREGGVAFRAMKSGLPEFVRHERGQGLADGKCANRSTLALALGQYVVALRGKTGMKSFFSRDVTLLRAVAPHITAALSLAGVVAEPLKVRGGREQLEAVALVDVGRGGWGFVNAVCKAFYGEATAIMLAVPFDDNKQMRFEPAGVARKAAFTAAGASYRQREIIQVSGPRAGFDEIWLLVGLTPQRHVCVPLRVRGACRGVFIFGDPARPIDSDSYASFSAMAALALDM